MKVASSSRRTGKPKNCTLATVQRRILGLLEIGAPHQLQLVDFDSDEQHDPAYLRLNPHGVVPTLLIDGVAYTESAAIMMMLAERHPAAKLVPAHGTAAYAAWLQWNVYLSNALAATYRFWFYPADLGMTEHTPEIRDALQIKIEKVWDRIEVELRTHGPYLLGAEFSGCDLLLTMLMRWSRNMPQPATQWPALKQLADLVKSRPSWQKMVALEELSAW